MRNAKSAKAVMALGATLFAMSVQVNAAGMNNGSAMGLGSSGTSGIDAGGVLGIDAGGVLGIDAGGVLGIDAGGVLGIDAGGVLLAGPVDSIDRKSGVFESMGQVVMASQSMLAGMNEGDYVSVAGSIAAPGWLYADDVFVSDELYVPGATEVFVSGMLTSVNSRNGTARMGDLTIDYTPSLGSAEAPSRAMWSFRGIMPSKRGVMISERSEPR